MIYDYENKRVLNELFIDKSDYYIVKKVMDMGLDVGIEVHSGDRVLTLAEQPRPIYTKNTNGLKAPI